VYVKSLTLRGFKSFASATSLRFEPGITCVVGPNGSGKSNIVDAFAWAMGEQGAKTLRGGKMDDVVFAGTASRPALGRAEVTLTIDNSDGALPIDYTEVTISRLLFRSGQSEYSINGNHCRLLDVAELLSDSGLGREMHVVVGQGQLDEVLHAGPEARRALIEEAAGVLKHRRRKEKALRKLEAMQANLTRLVDLTTELRRRLGPLGRQAAIARRAATIQADLRDARLRLLADDYVTVAAELERGQADEAAVLARRTELEQALAQARHQEAVLDADEQEQAPRLAGAQEAWFSLSALAERLRGMSNLARERHAHLTAVPGPVRRGRDPEELEAQAAALRAEEAALGERLETARARLSQAAAQRQAAEAEAAEAERLIAARARAAAERAERLAALRAQVGAARSRVTASEDEGARLAEALAQARTRADAAKHEHEQHQGLAAGRQDDRAQLAAGHEQAAAALKERSAHLARCRAAERAASAERAAVAARKDALEEGIRALMEGSDATAALLADPRWSSDVLGVVAALLTVDDGAQEAITAALGDAADAVAIAGLDAAVAVLSQLKQTDSGAAGLVIAGEHATAAGSLAVAGQLPPGDTPALELVRAPSGLSGALTALLGNVVVCESLAGARDIVRAHPRLRVVTRDGDLLGAHWARGGAARPPSMLAMRTAVDEAATGLAAAERACGAAAAGLAEAAAAEERAREAAQRAAAALQACDKLTAEVSGRLGRLAGAARAAAEETGRLAATVASVQDKQERDRAKLAELTARLTAAEDEDTAQDQAQPGEPAPEPEPDRETLQAQATAARETEMEARLEVRTAEERLRAIAGRADALSAAAAGERRAAQAAAQQARRRERQAVVVGAVARGAELALERIAQSLSVADAERLAAQEASKGRAEALKQVRAQVRTLTAELDKVVDSAHGAEITRAEHRMRLEQIGTRSTDEFGVDVATLTAEYGPDVGVPAPAEPPDDRPARKRGRPPATGNGAASGNGQVQAARPAPQEDQAPNDPAVEPAAATIPYVRAEQEKRAATAQRQLNQLGKVNPLALEEYAALEERHTFLATQLEDLKKTRRDLLTVVKEVDDRVREVFASAFADTAAEFEQVFARLFPGGEGRLVLTDPDDILASGIDVEARPPGKRVKRLSLLSGGERSLTALAYLLAIFKARPSPFYVLDEVEAALDDTNLQRLLSIFEELRDSSQLIVVTHQKRTMEVADALYGITMRGDGVSAVVSQRLRELERT
jgi:chromosome segregation protein